MTKEARMAKRGKRREDACTLLKSGSCRTKRSKPLPCISHEVLWSAMRPRIALTCRDHGVRVLMLVLLTIPPISIFGAAKSRPPPQLSGYKAVRRSEEHTSELQSPCNLVCRLLLEKKNQ